jgi:hypothetical protein
MNDDSDLWRVWRGPLACPVQSGRGRIDRPDGTRLTAHSTLRDCSQTLEPEAERWSRHGGVLGRRTGTFALFRVLLRFEYGAL